MLIALYHISGPGLLNSPKLREWLKVKIFGVGVGGKKQFWMAHDKRDALMQALLDNTPTVNMIDDGITAHHIIDNYALIDREVGKLKKHLLALSAMVEERVHHAVEAFSLRDDKLAQRIIDDDRDVDEMEVDIEEECLKILALYQPVATDLRFVIAVLKINNDLERIGDEAVNIAERALFLAQHDRAELPFDFTEMAEKTQSMLHRSLDALIDRA